MNRLEAIILKEKGGDGRPLTQLQIGVRSMQVWPSQELALLGPAL
jgi:hypothetical protein